MAPLRYVQRLAGLPEHISRVLVATSPGDAASVRTALDQRLGERLNVGPASAESMPDPAGGRAQRPVDGAVRGHQRAGGRAVRVHGDAADRAERRRFIAELRLQGFSTGQVATQVAFESLLLGVAASALGLLLGTSCRDTSSSRCRLAQLRLRRRRPARGQRRHDCALLRRRRAGDARRRLPALVRRFSTARWTPCAPMASRPRASASSPAAAAARRARARRADHVVVVLEPDLTIVAPASLALALVFVLQARSRSRSASSRAPRTSRGWRC